MAAHLSITLDEALYERLKRELPPKGISSFIEDAIRSKLRPDQTALEAAYRAASKETWRRGLTAEWSATELESWPG